ncbi:lysozyme inhibitor LprI family protein [Noviherbaspirillum saxi]|uniref:Lysozyme inhibitor LprI N-terminal domain-containing protein n=1 Tax=Noviherbaspirillum saxi TaxID=2320863 RepID=A0A3A3FW31_9BURK|nr:hypothetical protein [Noviherbaspirillum saxi]RJF99534.1 hypothetical protein D3871_14120 [Noviherbaspirillum saxi]
MKAVHHVIGISALLFATSIAWAASFDCHKARTPSEKLICSDPSLSKLDEDLNAAYKRALESGQDKTLIRHWQREWLTSYSVTSCTTVVCLKEAFSLQIKLLNQVALPNAETATWSGRYVRYWNGKEDRHTASILLIGLTGERVFATGSALWFGPNAHIGQVHTGEIEGVGKLQNQRLLMDSMEDCKASMKRKGILLVVDEESGCGGLNVTFLGEYRKK